MKREVIDCDRCGKECATHIHIDIPNGITRENDGVENRVYYDYEKKDLCPECAGKLLGFMFRMKKHEKEIETPYGCTEKRMLTEWIDGRHVHPSHTTNDTVDLALKWFKIKPKE